MNLSTHYKSQTFPIKFYAFPFTSAWQCKPKPPLSFLTLNFLSNQTHPIEKPSIQISKISSIKHQNRKPRNLPNDNKRFVELLGLGNHPIELGLAGNGRERHRDRWIIHLLQRPFLAQSTQRSNPPPDFIKFTGEYRGIWRTWRPESEAQNRNFGRSCWPVTWPVTWGTGSRVPESRARRRYYGHVEQKEREWICWLGNFKDCWDLTEDLKG